MMDIAQHKHTRNPMNILFSIILNIRWYEFRLNKYSYLMLKHPLNTISIVCILIQWMMWNIYTNIVIHIDFLNIFLSIKIYCLPENTCHSMRDWMWGYTINIHSFILFICSFITRTRTYTHSSHTLTLTHAFISICCECITLFEFYSYAAWFTDFYNNNKNTDRLFQMIKSHKQKYQAHPFYTNTFVWIHWMKRSQFIFKVWQTQ